MGEMFGSIRVDNGRRKIEVNDAGEYIEIAIDDVVQAEQIFALPAWLEAKQAEIDAHEAEMAERSGADGSFDRLPEDIASIKSVGQEAIEKIDAIFGDGASGKIFGKGVIPNHLVILDFFEQITGLYEQLSEARRKEINAKYGSRRTGGKKKK